MLFNKLDELLNVLPGSQQDPKGINSEALSAHRNVNKPLVKIKSCCDNEILVETNEYIVCSNCGIIRELDHEENYTDYITPYSALTPNYSMTTRIGFNYKYRGMFYIHSNTNRFLKELNLYRCLDFLDKLAILYKIKNKKIVYKGAYEYKKYYVDNKIGFGGQIKICMFFYCFKTSYYNETKEYLDEFIFLNYFDISVKKYNKMLLKINVKELLHPEIKHYYMIVKRLNLPICYRHLIHQYNLWYDHIYTKYQKRTPKTIMFATIHNLMIIHNKKIHINKFKKLLKLSGRSYYKLINMFYC